MRDWKELQPALNFARQNLGKNVALAELASRTKRSPFHAHRTLRLALGETPKQFTLRLRIDHAAAALVFIYPLITAAIWHTSKDTEQQQLRLSGRL